MAVDVLSAVLLIGSNLALLPAIIYAGVLLSVVDLTEIPLGRLFERVLNESVVYSATNRVVDNTVSWAASRILADAPAALLLGDGR